MDRFFLNPWALALGLLSGGIVLLYILKLRRKKVRISSTLLWETVISDTRANAPWQKLRKNLLMFIQILALLLLALALARPFIFGSAKAGGKVVVVIDTSASMLATDESPDRLGKAIELARRAVGDLGPAEEGMLIAAGSTPQLLASFSRDKRQLLGALDDVRQYAGGEADIDAALKLASSVTSGSRSRAVVISDGALPELDPLAVRDLKLSYTKVGSESANMAITGAGARQNPFTGQYDLFAAVQSYESAPEDVDVVVNRGAETADVRTVSIGPGERQEVNLTGLGYSSEPYEISLDRKDLLEEDNRAYVTLPEETPLNVALCTSGESILLRKALENVRGVVLSEYKDGQLYVPEGVADDVKIDCWVVDGDAAAPEDLVSSYIFFNTSKHIALPVVAGPEAMLDFSADPPVIPMVVGLDRASPLLRFVSIGDIKLKSMRRCTLQPWGKAAVDGSEGPLVVTGDNNGQRTVYVAFSLYDSDFPLRAGFPIFLANALRFLGSSGAANSGRTIPAGTQVDMLAPPLAARAEVSGPAKSHQEIALAARGYTLRGLDHPGIYRIDYLDESGKPVGRIQVPVSLVNAEESNIAPADTLRVTGVEEALASGGEAATEEIAAMKDVRVNREFYTLLILVMMGLICVEWLLFHTRAL